MGIPRGVYAAKPNLPGLDLRRLFFLKLTPMVHRKTAPTGPEETGSAKRVFRALLAHTSAK